MPTTSVEAAFGLYVHIPFCPQHCPYCAFAVVTGHYDLYERYVEAVCAEIRQWRHLADRAPFATLFFGGGTPSMLEPAQVERICDAAQQTLGIAPDAEISLEANPNGADSAKFPALRRLGINRLSIGVQSFNDVDLKILGRRHTAAQARAACHAAQEAGFDNLSLDLMFSLPGALRAHWQGTVHQALRFQPTHISTYSLTIEEGTRFAHRYHQGRLQPVSEEDDAWAYAWTMETLQAAGYEHYEVSNFARPGRRSRHNWGYWHGASYLGVGLSAHSFFDATRRWNTRNMRAYLEAVESGRSPCEDFEVVDSAMARRERMAVQLRTCVGVQLAPDELQVLQASETFQAMLAEQLVRLEASRLSLTATGLQLADAIGVEIVTIVERGLGSLRGGRQEAVGRRR
jgi:oxygen-independent coproporphyrinogen-3 oxidase